MKNEILQQQDTRKLIVYIGKAAGKVYFSFISFSSYFASFVVIYGFRDIESSSKLGPRPRVLTACRFSSVLLDCDSAFPLFNH